MSLYTKEMARAVRSVDKPVRFTLDYVEHIDGMSLRVYKDEIVRMSEPERVKVMEYLIRVQHIIQKFGITCFIEGAEGEPPTIQRV